MPQNDNITTKFKVDISDLKAGISQANQQMKLANAQFKAAAAGMDDWQKSSEGLKAKLNQLDSVLAANKAKLQSYTDQLKRQEDAYKENGKRADELKTKLKELVDKGVSKTSTEYKQYANALKDVEKEQLANEKAADDLRITILNQQAAVNGTEKEIRQYSDALDKMESEAIQAERTAGELSETMDELDESANSSSGGFTILKGALSELVADGIRSAISAIKDFAAETIEVGKQFDKSMSNVAALSGATGEELEMLRETAKQFGSTTIFSASQSADALGYMALAGWDAQQSVDALGGVLNLAAASGMDLAEASDMVTDYMSAFGMEAKDSAYFSDLLAYAQANANTTARGLGEAFQNSAANLNAAGQDIETVVSLLSMMANQGLKGSRAGTALSAVMRDLTKNMENGAVAIGETNVQVMDADGNYRDLTDILWDVEAATKGMGDAQKAAALSSTFTADSIKGLNLILNAGVDNAFVFEEQLRAASVTSEGFARSASKLGINVDALRQAYEEAGGSLESFEAAIGWSRGTAEDFVDALANGLPVYDDMSGILDSLGISLDDLQVAMDNASGSAEMMSEIMNDNLNGDLTALGSKMEGVQITLYEKLEPALRTGVELLSSLLDVVDWIVQHSDGFIAALTAMGVAIATYVAYNTAITIMKDGFMALEVAQKAVTAAQWLMNAAMNASGLGIIISLVAALVAAFVVLWNKSEAFRNFFIAMWEGIKATVNYTVKTIQDLFSGLWEGIKKIFAPVGDFFAETFGKVKGAISAPLNFVIRGLNKLINGLNSINFSVPDWVPLIGGKSFGIKIPNIPELEKGGVLSRGQWGYLEGNGAEAVVPLERNKKWIRAVAEDMRRAISADSGFLGTGAGIYTAGAANFTQIINAPKQPSRIELYRQTKNLLEMARGVS